MTGSSGTTGTAATHAPREAFDTEASAIAERYARRAAIPALAARYGAQRPEVQRERHLRESLFMAGVQHRLPGWRDDAQDSGPGLDRLDLLDLGCGHGEQLQDLLRLGFAPQRLQGCDLLPERLAVARQHLPPALRLWPGDARALDLPPHSLHLVLQSTVFSSILAPIARQQLADTLWRWLRPGGALVWYDLALPNPRNPDVCALALPALRDLFPQAKIDACRVTLLPPLARAVARLPAAWQAPLHQGLHTLPWLRSHLFAWIDKPQ